MSHSPRLSFIATRFNGLETYRFSSPPQSFQIRFDGWFYRWSRSDDDCEFPHFSRRAAVAAMFTNAQRTASFA